MVKIRLTDKKVEEVVRSICGDDVLDVISYLKGKENVSEFKLAEDLEEDIKRIRNILYRLYGSNLVEFTRKKDKKKGWYIYYWTFKPDQIRFLYVQLRKDQLTMFKKRHARESKEQFFICPNKCTRMDFEQAVNFEYQCPECGDLVIQDQNIDKIKLLATKIKKLEKEIKSITS